MQTELHRHMDVSLRAETLLNLAQERGLVSQSTSLESFQESLFLKKPMSDLTAVLAQFTLFQKVQDRPEVLERVAFEAVEDCWNEGTRHAELRYAPSFVCEYSTLSWKDTLDSYSRGIQRALKEYPGMSAGLICIAVRDFGTEAVAQAVEFFLENRTRFLGLDLAGNEDKNPCRLFESAFSKAIRAKANITIHAGEACGPENMWEAIELLGARRIGHGVACIQDPKLMRTLAEKQICLEVCPTSNWITNAVPSLADHPLPKILRAGVPVSINTDDPGIFGITLPHEIQVCRTQLRMTDSEIAQCMTHARAASFGVRA